VNEKSPIRGLNITLDGYNLALDKGTGVATYGRNLSSVLKYLGAEINVLYGSSIKEKHEDLLKEVMFFDAPPLPQHRLLNLLRLGRSILAGNCSRAFEVPRTGAVVVDDLRYIVCGYLLPPM
jgi:hypothetical protein